MTVLTILYSFLHFIFSILSTFLLLISYFPASFTYGTQLTFTYSKSTIETPEHLLKVNNKDTRTSLMLFWCLQFWRDFTHCSGVSIVALCKSCPNAEFYWFIFSHIWTQYGDLRSKSPYSVQIRENTDQKNSVFRHFSRSVDIASWIKWLVAEVKNIPTWMSRCNGYIAVRILQAAMDTNWYVTH